MAQDTQGGAERNPVTLKAIALMGLLLCCVLWGRVGKWYEIEDSISATPFDLCNRDLREEEIQKLREKCADQFGWALIATALEFLLIAHL